METDESNRSTTEASFASGEISGLAVTIRYERRRAAGWHIAERGETGRRDRAKFITPLCARLNSDFSELLIEPSGQRPRDGLPIPARRRRCETGRKSIPNPRAAAGHALTY